jgi:hypothetical protein
MSVKMRQMVEKKIYTKVIDALLEAGFGLSVDNGDNSGGSDSDYEYEIHNSRNRKAILDAMSLTDEDRLYVIGQGSVPFGWVYFVYGNDGWDVINAYTVNLEKYIGDGTEVEKVIKKYED